MAQNGWIVVSSQFSPSQSGIKLKDLVSRFNSGLVYRIKELNDEQKAEAFSWAARRRGLELTEETVTWVLRRAPRETQSLFLLLDKIDQTALQTGERVTIPFLRKHKILESRLIA
jgi:DnaA family protein